MMRALIGLWAGFRGTCARHRSAAIALVSLLVALLLAFGVTPYAKVAVAVLAPLLILLIGSAPDRYAAVPRLDSLLPIVFRVLELRNGDRVAVHVLLSLTGEKYEQLTDYYPRPGKSGGRGRVFRFSEGIVGRAFKTRRPQRYAIPTNRSFEDAMQQDWGFSDMEVKALTSDRRSYMAYPIGQRWYYASAVLYLDSPDAERFNEVQFTTYVKRVEELFSEAFTEAFRAR